MNLDPIHVILCAKDGKLNFESISILDAQTREHLKDVISMQIRFGDIEVTHISMGRNVRTLLDGNLSEHLLRLLPCTVTQIAYIDAIEIV